MIDATIDAVAKYRKLYERGIYSKDETAMYLAELLSCTQAEAMAKLFPPTPDFDPLMKAHVETLRTAGGQ